MRVPFGEDGSLTVRVASDSGEGHYVVRRLPGGDWSCTCPDHACRHRECKHIARVRRRITELAQARGGLL